MKTRVDDDRRSAAERRDVVRHGRVLIEKLKNTPLFRDFTPDKYAGFIAIAAQKEMRAGAVIYRAGNNSNDIYVLIEGILEVSVGGKSINMISPISFVGEMEFMSGEPRTASVTSKTDSILLRFSRRELERIFQGDSELHITFLESIVADLSSKLFRMNKVFATMKDRRKP
ncbi:MAG: cyclic nucleotide-binding domain-containing protein [Candidatus Latescibacteria bacterium]|nr:cyclic nucleotide-binding domain-containing protein [Candidatus Latescibacterota bacterium]